MVSGLGDDNTTECSGGFPSFMVLARVDRSCHNHQITGGLNTEEKKGEERKGGRGEEKGKENRRGRENQSISIFEIIVYSVDAGAQTVSPGALWSVPWFPFLVCCFQTMDGVEDSVWQYFEFWCFPVYLLLYTFQSRQVSVSCMLSRFHSSIQWRDRVWQTLSH